MVKRLKRYTLQCFKGANVATILTMLLIGYSDWVSPVAHPNLSNIGLLFPFLLFINLLFVLFWILFHLRGVIIPIVGFVVCYQPLRTYCPFNVSASHPDGSLKVLSFNTMGFAGWADNTEKGGNTVRYIIDQGADIVCLQESPAQNDSVTRALYSVYQYHDTARLGHSGDQLMLLSRYPIVKKEHIPYESQGNLSAAFYLRMHGDTVIVINNHLESTKLTPAMRTKFNNMVEGEMRKDSVKEESKLLIVKLGEGTALRAPQADAVARYISEHRDKSIICAGDFNDSPISYTHRVIARDLVDCYVATGNGPGISYHKNSFYVRIDNILSSNDWAPYECKIDKKYTQSDHYPIICWLKKKGNS